MQLYEIEKCNECLKNRRPITDYLENGELLLIATIIDYNVHLCLLLV